MMVGVVLTGGESVYRGYQSQLIKGMNASGLHFHC